VVRSLPPQGGSKGPYLHLSHSTASKNPAYMIGLPSTFVAHPEV